MDNKRQRKISRLIQKDLGEIFQRETNSLFNGAFVTVTQVYVTPDLSLAKVYLSFMLAKDKEELMRVIEQHKGQIRHALAQRVRHQLRKVPELDFYIDNTQEVVAEVEQLFEELDIPPKEEEEDEEEGQEGKDKS